MSNFISDAKQGKGKGIYGYNTKPQSTRPRNYAHNYDDFHDLGSSIEELQEEVNHARRDPEEEEMPPAISSNNDDPLPIASEVQTPPELLHRLQKLEEQQSNVPHATRVDENDTVEKQRREKRRIGIIVVSAVLIILAIVLGTVFGTRNKGNASMDPAPSPTLSSESEAVKDLIESVSLDGGVALQNASSPQSMALEWLQGDNANATDTYTDWRLIQRYVLAVLYFSTNGDNWDDSTNWLSSKNECTWFTSSSEPLCNETNGRYLRVVLSENDLSGTVPVELALLSDSLRKYVVG